MSRLRYNSHVENIDPPEGWPILDHFWGVFCKSVHDTPEIYEESFDPTA